MYGSIYSTDINIERTIKLFYQGRQLTINNDSDTPWKYDDVRDNIYVAQSMGSYKQTLGSTIFISEPIYISNGTFKLNIQYTINTTDRSGNCEQ